VTSWLDIGSLAFHFKAPSFNMMIFVAMKGGAASQRPLWSECP
jgi:hypothetical protein